MKNIFLFLITGSIVFFSCTKKSQEDLNDAKVTFSFKFDETQDRLDSFGQPSSIPSENAALSPSFSQLSAHFIELVPTELTPYQSGAFIYKGAEVPANNSNNFSTAIDFDNAILGDETAPFLEVPLKDIQAGVYNHLRVSVAYQNYEVKYNLNNIPVVGDLKEESGTIGSFVGYNTQINKLKIFSEEIDVNDAKLQGYWAFETQFAPPFTAYNQVLTGSAPANATTVVNPFPSSPIPLGSCVVSGSFDAPLTITGAETEDIHITISFSTNKSFEWKDLNGNNQWDLDAQNPNDSEPVVDMGLRGMKAFF